MSDPPTVKVGITLMRKMQDAIEAALRYEKATRGRRKLGITGEAGEILACRQLGLELVLDSRSAGYDAVDRDGLRVQIKSRRSESGGLPNERGRISTFSKHEFDYAILVLLAPDYTLREIWKADYQAIMPVVDRQKRRNPNLSSFKRVASKIFTFHPE